MSRRRLTWREAAFRDRRADPYQMNQTHLDPTPVAYESGDPSVWAEDVIPYDSWKQDYIPRNEIGEGTLRHETFDHHSDKVWGDGHPYDNPTKTDMDGSPHVPSRMVGASVRASMANRMKLAKVLEAKAEKCIRIATEMLGEGAPEEAIEQQAFALMSLNDEAVETTIDNLKAAAKAKDEDESGESKSAHGKSEEKSDDMKMAGMDEFKSAMSSKSKEKSDEDDKTSAKKSEEKSSDEEKTAAKMARMARLRRMAAYGSKSDEESSKSMEKSGASKEKSEEKSAAAPPAAPNDPPGPSSKEYAGSVPGGPPASVKAGAEKSKETTEDEKSSKSAAKAKSDEKTEESSKSAAKKSEEKTEEESKTAADDYELSTMDNIDGAKVSTDSNEDELLKQLFAAGPDAEESKEEESSKSASKTAKKGVSKLASVTPAAGNADDDQLSRIWRSAPDVSDIFGQKR